MEPLYKAHEVAARLREKYGATIRESARPMQIEFPDIPHAFELSADDELTLFTDSWHEHFDTMKSLEAFLDHLFAGRLEVIVTYRGSTPVAHRIVGYRDGETHVLSRTGILLPLFWRRKSQRTLTYRKTPDHAIERTADRAAPNF
jgi:hypothetical protein